ncbi:helix-turn-helix domain-containing protein [Oribacterium sp. P6A1]|uniref:helix-turn-helix domain-containing protein n=1 Tax=Oribacterium sp. P6A1 TaxID=1410612 RepID=UPI00068A865E|nr:helix-turn-helix transcriptional regulator [Oribacterium sp. P6A1]
MTISERIFERLAQLSMTQKEFSEKTGILPSTISEWKKNKTNPSSEKIMPICEAIGVTPEWLLSGIDPAGSREEGRDYYTVKKNTDMGRLISYYNMLEQAFRERMIGYAEAYASLKEKDEGTHPKKKGTGDK